MALHEEERPQTKPRRSGRKRVRLSTRWRRLRKRVLRSGLFNRLLGRAVFEMLGFIRRSQRLAPGSSDWTEVLTRQHPAIVALWHGQHLLAPFFRPKTLPYVALLSRNADAALNAEVVELFGIKTVRGSGGRTRQRTSKRGGAQALIAMRRMLAEGHGVCMIADVPKGTPREAGLGIVTLAQISGRPIIPSAAITSRHYVVKSSWDKTTLPLPFGQLAVVLGEPIFVARDADAAALEAARLRVTDGIQAADRTARRLAGLAA
ncbi:lysophospholipid acyltransferase family protein [Mangrovibrevibacter kandeliae]|uniref:lysophospholipid acyltransferase family protein n=1 Tax=Mangrovibrevibacter kandeliae TaxID=2968473 RepID=UPI0021186A99|nr:lysophospholipid acyltransferase family protein [Aurantimonas sp. CSK15Z-1]MCQ8782043.1 lysophospholipid acyltransferase family protein [Aurantimonas sp. CSK15Z-1]